MCDSCFWKSFLVVYCPDKYKTQKICDKAIYDLLAALKLIPDRIFTNKTIKELFTALYADENIFYLNEDSSNAILSFNEMGVLNKDLNSINLDNKFDEDDPDTIILIRIFACIINLKNAKHVKKDK